MRDSGALLFFYGHSSDELRASFAGAMRKLPQGCVKAHTSGSARPRPTAASDEFSRDFDPSAPTAYSLHKQSCGALPVPKL